MEIDEQLKVVQGPLCKNAILRNASDFLEEARKGNVECCLINYRRKDNGSIRSFIELGKEGKDAGRLLKCVEIAKWYLMQWIVGNTVPAHPEIEELEEE